MKNWSISFRLLCLAVIAVMTFVFLGLYGIYNARSTFGWVSEVNSTAQDFQRSAREISDPLHGVRELVLLIVMAPDRAYRERLNAAQEAKSRQLDEAFKGWQADRMDSAERAAFNKLRTAWEDYRKLKDYTVDRARNGYREEAFINATETAAPQFDLAVNELEVWQKLKINSAQAVYRDAGARFKWVFRTSILVTALTALLVGTVAFFIVRSITGPIRILTTTAARIADRVDDPESEKALTPVLGTGGEVGQLARGFWRMVSTLRSTLQNEIQSRARMDEILRSTRAAVGQIGSTSAQLLESTREQATGAEKQADAVTRVVTTVEEVTGTARQAATRAKNVGQTVLHTVEIGNAGRRAADDSVSALNEVRKRVEVTSRNMMDLIEQTKAISDIIATVDDIAQQSHVLAVNAAIEAAKAREGGKEFTVIASEIRAMAEQSRQGTAQVRQILDQILKAGGAAVLSMEEVTKGVSGAIREGDQSSKAINELTVALADVAETSVQTAVAAEQEAIGMTQISEAMRNIDLVAKNALLAIQGTAQAARQLDSLGSQLRHLSAERENGHEPGNGAALAETGTAKP
ncbi:MAG: methyl-accepting chemotaxis protein [Chthoniobacteraceae bacterium]